MPGKVFQSSRDSVPFGAAPAVAPSGPPDSRGSYASPPSPARRMHVTTATHSSVVSFLLTDWWHAHGHAARRRGPCNKLPCERCCLAGGVLENLHVSCLCMVYWGGGRGQCGGFHEMETLAPAFSSKSLNFAASSLVSPALTNLGAPEQ